MRKVFGIELDGTTTVMTIGRTQLPILGGSYGDNLQKEKLREMGVQIITAITMGTYETEEAKIRMSASTYRGLFLPLVPAGWGNLVVPVVFSFTHPQLGGDSDFLDGCSFTKPAQSLEASGKPQEVELAFVVSQIYWGESRKPINSFDTSLPIGPSLL